MRFADDAPKAWVGWAGTLALIAVLVLVFRASDTINVPTVVRVHTEKKALSVQACLQSPEGRQLLGELTRVHLVSRPRTGPKDRLYSTSKGHLILFTEEESGETVLRVKDREQVNEDQLQLLSACADEVAMW